MINGAVLQQVFVVEYIVQSQMCEDCHRIEAKDFWKAVVQVRQKVEAKGIFSGSEQNNQTEKSLDACLIFSEEGVLARCRSDPFCVHAGVTELVSEIFGVTQSRLWALPSL